MQARVPMHRQVFWELNALAGLSGLGWHQAPTQLLSPGQLPQDTVPAHKGCPHSLSQQDWKHKELQVASAAAACCKPVSHSACPSPPWAAPPGTEGPLSSSDLCCRA